MKNVIFILLLSVFTQFAWSSGGVGNGEGLGEQRVTTINQYLPTYIDFCIKGGCSFNASDIEMAKKVLAARYASKKFKFLSGHKNPGYFESGATFKADSYTGSEVTINIDALYLNEKSIINALPIEDAVKLIVQVYHYQINDGSADPVAFSKKLTFAVSRFISTIEHSFDFNYLKVSLFKSGELYKDNLFVSDSATSIDLGAVLREKFKCAGSATNITFLNAFWLPSTKPFSVYFNGTLNCDKSIEVLKVSIELKLKNLGSPYPGALPRMRLEDEGGVGEVKLIKQ